MTASTELTAAAHDAEETDMTPTMEQLQALKDAAVKANSAYTAFQRDGTVSADIRKSLLMDETLKADREYEDALKIYMKSLAARNDRNMPRDYALEQEAERETAQGVGELRKAGL